LIFAYVIMPDHLHIITDGSRKASDTLRFLNGISSRRVMQRVNYIHQNPVRAGLVERAEDYRWSSVRCWTRRPREDEPVIPDIDKIEWRKPR
jgi:REP element-mobilizing transposase RayT